MKQDLSSHIKTPQGAAVRRSAIWLTGLLFIAMTCWSTVALSASVDIPPNPPHWWNSENHDFWVYTHWDAPAEGSPDEEDSNFGAVANITVSGDDVTFDITNGEILQNDKKLFFRMEGTSTAASGAPFLTELSYGATDGATFGTLETTVQPNGDWVVELRAVIKPQPDTVRIRFTKPSLVATGEAWYGDFCFARLSAPVPVLSATGLAILGLFLLFGAKFGMFGRKGTTL